MVGVSVPSRLAVPASSVRTGLLLVAVTVALYAVLPSFAPQSISASQELLLGVITGIVVGLGSRVDSRFAPYVGLAAFVTVVVRFIVTGGSPATVVPIAAVIGLEIVAMIVVIQSLDVQRLRRPQDVLLLVLVSFCTGLAAGCLSAVAVQVTSPGLDVFFHVARTWTADAMFGLLCIAPAFMTVRRPRHWQWGAAVEFALVTAVTAMICVYLFRFVTPGHPGLLGWPYLVLLGPLWLAVRLGVAAATPVMALVAWFAVASTANGFGAFSAAAAEAIDKLIAVQLFSTVMAITILLIAILRDARLRSLKEVSQSSRLLHEVVNGTQALVFAKSYDEDEGVSGRYVLVNEAWEEQTGRPAEETIGRTDAELFTADVADPFRVADLEVLQSRAAITAEELAPSADGHIRNYSTSKFPLLRADGTIWGVGGIATDTTDLVRLLERERKQAGLLRAVFELSPTPALRLNVDSAGSTELLAANASMCTLMGADESAMQECVLMEHVHPDDATIAEGVLAEARRGRGLRQSGGARQREVRMLTFDGRTVWTLMSAASVGSRGADGDVEVVVQFEDFTARRLAEEALSNQALRDPVTGLPNRRALQDRLSSALHRMRRQDGVLAVLFCDLDRFKDVNDTQGHQSGDLLLVEVARRMQGALRPEDTVARLGGDEFVAMGEGISDIASAVQLAMRVLEKVSAPWIQGELVYRPSVSIGVAIVDDPDLTADEVLRRADLAMYRAKDNGRGRIEIYEKSVDDLYRHAVAMQHDLRRAIDDEGLVLHFQPIVELMDGSVIGAEALVRMVGRDGLLLQPSTFVPAAETSGLIIPMGAWVLRQAVSQLKAWSVAERDLTLSVNVSPSQLRDEGFADFLLAQLESAGVNPRRLAVEVTETALLNEPGRSARELNALSREGVGIYLDDFGTGYSSLSWLTQFPVDVVKIDRTFTDELGIDERKTAIVSALIQVSHELGFSVVAEGVETTLQADQLIDLGCDRGQGFLYGRPTAISSPQWL